MSEDAVNLRRLADNFGDDPEFLHEIYTTYLHDCADNLLSLKESITNQDMKTRSLNAHAIKGASANIGAEKVKAIAAELEVLDHESAQEVATEIYDRLEIEFDIARDFLNSFLVTLKR